MQEPAKDLKQVPSIWATTVYGRKDDGGLGGESSSCTMHLRHLRQTEIDTERLEVRRDNRIEHAWENFSLSEFSIPQISLHVTCYIKLGAIGGKRHEMGDTEI